MNNLVRFRRMTENAIMNTYARFPLTLSSGSGCRVRDDQGKEYLDFVSGIAVNTLGHAHPRMQATIADQASRLLHCSNLYHIPQQQQLAERLAKLSGLDQTFFCNSGAEANEAAIKLARRFFYQQQSSRRTIISATQSFHGRLLSTLTATGQEKVKIGFDPLPSGFLHVPFNDFDALEQTVNEQTAAILLEPLQGEGGINVANSAYLQAVRKLCDHHGILLILDEIQTGIGRCGAMFAFELAHVLPDILTLAKGLGGGMPIGCMMARANVGNALGPGTHGSTFGGNPLSCSTALTVLDVIEEESLLKNVQLQGQRLQRGLQKLTEKHTQIIEVRGQGLLQGVACRDAVMPVIMQCMHDGLLTLSAGPNVLRLLPPLNVTGDDIDEALHLLEQAMQKVWK